MTTSNRTGHFVAKTFMGLEEVLAKELLDLGSPDVQILKRGVQFIGDKELLYRANYCCRTALRILKPISVFSIRNQKELYQQAYDFNWEDFLSLSQTFAIDPVVNSSLFTHTHFPALLCKDAIADRFKSLYKRRPNVDKDKPDIKINLHIQQETVTLSLDSSGVSLHQRGYRVRSVPAPLNEVLAAGLLSLSGWDAATDLYDPMCGSGTILIEGAMKAMNIPAGLFRKTYAFQNWKDFDKDLWDFVVYENEPKETALSISIRGCDISMGAVRASHINIKRANLDKHIRVTRQDFSDFSPEKDRGMLITNPPYGERMESGDQLSLYRSIGDNLKQRFAGHSAWIFTGDLEALKHTGLKPSKKIILFNGPLECRFANFDLYEGSKKAVNQG